MPNKGSSFSAFASASAEHLPDVAEGKTSKRTSHGHCKYGGLYHGKVNEAILPAKRVTEKTYRGIKIPSLIPDTTLYAEISAGYSYVDAQASAINWRMGRAVFEKVYTARNPIRAGIGRKMLLSPHVSVPTVTKEVVSQASAIEYYTDASKKVHVVRPSKVHYYTLEGEQHTTIQYDAPIAGDTYLHVVKGLQVPRVTTVQKADSFHKPILSAKNATDAKYYASLLNQNNPILYVRDTNANGWTVRERYAESIGIDISVLRKRGAAFNRKQMFASAFMSTEEYTRICRNWYNTELERKIAIANNPAIKKERETAARHKLRREAHEFNRKQNKKAKNKERAQKYYAEMDARIAQQSA